MRPAPFVVPLAACLAVLAGAAEPAGHGAVHAHAAAGPGTTDLRADAAFDAEGRLRLVRHRDGFVEVLSSSDLGRTWGAPVRVNAAREEIDPGGDARPKILPGPSGRLFITWTRPLARPYTGEIRFSRSTDGGLTFEEPRTVHRDRAEITHRFDALALDREGRLFIAWIDKRDAVAAAASGRSYRGAALYYAVSSDAGATFAGDFKAADHTCECCRIALAPAAGGGVQALWRHIFEPNVRDHATARLGPDGIAGPVRRATFDDWRVDACPHHGPSLAPDDRGALHAVWFTATEAGGRAAYGRLGADAPPAATRQLGGKLAGHADLLVAGPRIVAAWKEFADGMNQLRATASDDGGLTWRNIVLAATAGACSQPRVMALGPEIHVFWNTQAGPLLHRVTAAEPPSAGKSPP